MMTAFSAFMFVGHNPQTPCTCSQHFLAMRDLPAKAHCLDILRQQLMCTVDVGVLYVFLGSEGDCIMSFHRTYHENEIRC